MSRDSGGSPLEPSWDPHLNREDAREDGAGNAYLGASLHKAEERVSLKE